MPLRYTLTLRKDAQPHLPVEKYLEIIKRGSTELRPDTKASLEMIKHYNLQFIPLNLKNEIIISWEWEVTLTRPLEPNIGTFVRARWDENQKKNWKEDHLKVIKEVLATYEEMGYEAVEDQTGVTVKSIEEILTMVDKDEAKAKVKLARMQKINAMVQKVKSRGKKKK